MPEPIRVLRVIARLNMGGPAIHVSNLAAGLETRGYHTTLVAGSLARGEDSMAFVAERLGVSVVSVPEIQREVAPLHDLQSIRRLTAIMREERPHILHTHTAKAGALARAAALAAGSARPPIIVHTFHGHVLKGYFGPGRTAFFKQVERTLARTSDVLVAVSPEVRDELVEHGIAPAEKFTVIRLGIPLEERLGDETADLDYRALYGIPADAFVVGWVGRMTGVKDADAVLEIVRATRERGIPAVLCMVGDGPDRERLEQVAHDLGIARSTYFVGYQPDVAGYYRLFDAFLLPSVNEGTPVSAIEALASGTPVVATRVGGVPDVVTDGVDGFLVEPGDDRGSRRSPRGARTRSEAADAARRRGARERARALLRRTSRRRRRPAVSLAAGCEGVLAPAAGRAAVRPAEERQRGAQQDLEIQARRAVLDVPDVELDAVGPWERRATVDLRPARQPRTEVEPTTLVLVVLLDLVAQRGTWPDDAHVAAQDVPELRQLVDRRSPEDAPDPCDPAIALVDRIAGTHAFRAHDHRAQLQHVEVDAALTHPSLAVENRAAILELDRERGEAEERAREREPDTGDGDVRSPVHRVPLAFSQVCGVPERR